MLRTEAERLRAELAEVKHLTRSQTEETQETQHHRLTQSSTRELVLEETRDFREELEVALRKVRRFRYRTEIMRISRRERSERRGMRSL